jgi:heat shock protein HslJ
LNQTFQRWVGRSLAIALVMVAGQPVFAQDLRSFSGAHTHSTPTDITVAMSDSLEGITWQLVSYRADDGLTVEAFSERPATLLFEDGQVTGTTGCNRFFSDYSREGDQLTISAGGSTLMACIDEALAAQEAAMLMGLSQVAGYSQTSEQLLLVDSNGTTLFTLVPQPTAALTGTEWTLTVYNNGRGGLTTPIIDTTITAQFNTEGRLAGSAGCNRYRATFETNGDSLTLGPAASTRRLCPGPEGIMAQELAFLSVLEDVATYTIRGNQLDLNNAEGTTLARFTTEL